MTRVTTVPEARALIERVFESALVDIDPRIATKHALTIHNETIGFPTGSVDVPDSGFIVVAIGKAASPMTAAAAEMLRGHIRSGVILTKDGHATVSPSGFKVYEARHPVPDERGVLATRKILADVTGLTPDDTVIALISGGGSALLESPKLPLTLEDVQITTDLMLKEGAPIQDLNAVRSELSDIKGGGLRRAIGPARCVSLILSDVLGNDSSVIASGPTIWRSPDRSNARRVINKYGLWDRLPAAVRSLLEKDAGDEVSGCRDVRDDDIYKIIGDNARLQAAIRVRFEGEQLVTLVAMKEVEGEARVVSRVFVDRCLAAPPDVDVVIGGGETTVTVRGNGEGGRNTEFALAAALELDARNADWVIASLASDGQDGTVDAAGAIVDQDTIQRGNDHGLDAVKSLEGNDSGSYFRVTGELVIPGPTGTNVNDVYIGIRIR